MSQPLLGLGAAGGARRYYQLFCGTAPTHHLYGLRTALDMILEEGLDPVWFRHGVFARAVWAAVDAWGAGGALELNMRDPRLRSHAVTTIRTAPGDGTRLRRWCADTAGLTLGIGLGVEGTEADSVFRIGHMGHLNPPMLLGTLATIEAGLQALGIRHGGGGTAAASAVVAAAGEAAPTDANRLEVAAGSSRLLAYPGRKGRALPEEEGCVKPVLILLTGVAVALSACASETPEQKHEVGCMAGTLTGAVIGGLAGSLIGGGAGRTSPPRPAPGSARSPATGWRASEGGTA